MLAPVSRPLITEANGWLGRLDLNYVVRGNQTSLHHVHQGPLRILKSLYPECPSVCHNIMVHPPSGLIGSDRIEVNVQMAEATHAFITTPGATRFLGRSSQWATQTLNARLAPGARLEWFPMETLIYSGSWAKNQMFFDLAPHSSVMYWDLYALGLQATGQPFTEGSLETFTECKGKWREHGLVRANDHVLLDGPLGLQGHRTLGQLVLLWDQKNDGFDVEDLLQKTHEFISHLHQGHVKSISSDIAAGVTESQPGVIQLRAIADQVRDLHSLFQSVWSIWRRVAWGMNAIPSRSWNL